MAAPRPSDDDLPALPPLDGGDEEPRAEEEGEADEEEESVGLDDATGTGDTLADELDPGDENESYLEGSEPDPQEMDEDVEAGDEAGGWTDFDGQSGGHDDDDDESSGDDEAVAAVDRGEEGLVDEEPVRGNEGDEAELPASATTLGLADLPDLPDESLDVRDEAERDADDADGESDRRLSGASLPAVLASGVTARWVLLEGGASALAPSGDAVLVAGTTLARIGETAQTLGARGLDALGVTSVVVAPSSPEVVLVGTRLAGVLASRDGGEGFAPANGWQRGTGALTRAFDVTLERHAGGARVWGRTGGALYRTEDLGRTWHGPLMVAPAVALAACVRGEGGVAVVSAAGEGARLLRSQDGGLRWSSQALPARPHGAGDALLALAGDRVAFAWERDVRGPLLRDASGETHVPELAAAVHLALVPVTGEAGDGVELWAVLFFPGTDRSVLVRRDARGGLRTVADVAALALAQGAGPRDVDDEGDGRVLALLVTAVGARRDAWLATARGLLHVTVSA